MRIDTAVPVAPDQSFVVDAFRPDDAPRIANLFLTVYGPDYPVDTYYYPEKLIHAVKAGNLHPVVCRTETGDIIACGAIYHSAPPNRNLFEFGQYMVLREYRKTTAAFRMTNYIANTIIPSAGIEGLFGEAVTNHTTSQKIQRILNSKDCGIELLLMPASLYLKEQSARGRVSCVMGFRIYQDRPQEVYLPAPYAETLQTFIAQLGLSRTILPNNAEPQLSAASMLNSVFIDHAGIVRVHASEIGEDFADRLSAIEADADRKSAVVRQWFLNLSDSGIGSAVSLLRRNGYFLGGYLPQWFGADGMLMQKVTEEPDFDALQIYSDEAIALLDIIRTDRESVRA